MTPEMIARQNGWLGCADAIGAWVRERDRDLESRPAGEDYDEEGQSLGTGGLESVGRAQRERHGSFCACDAPDCPGLRSRRLHVKHSIENAISLFKAAGSGHSSSPTPAASVFGDALQDVPGTPEGVRWERRPSLPHTHEEGSSQSQVWRSPFSSASSRRPSSAGTGASEGGGSVRTTPRKLGSKYSLLNLFKKASGEGESAGGTGSGSTTSVAASANNNHNTATDGQGVNHGQSPPESPRPGIGLGILHRAHGRSGSGSGSVSQPPPRALRFDSSSSGSSSGSNSSQPPGVESAGAKPPSSPRDRQRDDEEEEEEEEYGQPIPSRMGLGVGEEGSPKPSLRTGGLRSRGQSQTSQLSPLEDPRADPHPEQDSTSADVAPGIAPALLPPPPMMMGPGVLLDGERNHVSPDTYTFTHDHGSPSPSPSPPRRPDLSPPSTGVSTFGFMGAGDGRLRGDSMSSATLSVGTSASTASGGAPATPAGALGTVLSSPVVASPGQAAQELELELLADDAGEARGGAGKDGEYYDATFGLGLSGAGVGAGVGGRRAHAPLDIDIRAISSHAQAEALVARAQQSILELGHMEAGGEAGGGGAGLGVGAVAGGADAVKGPGQQQQQQQQGLPLSARLAVYGESLALERRLKMEMERGKEREREREREMERARERQWEREKERRRGRGKGWGRDMERSASASASAGAGVVAFDVDVDGGAGAVVGVGRPYGVKVRSASATMDREAAVAGLGLAGGAGPQWRRQDGEQYQRHGSLEGPRRSPGSPCGRGVGAGSSPRGAKGRPPKVRRPHTSGGVPGDEGAFDGVASELER